MSSDTLFGFEGHAIARIDVGADATVARLGSRKRPKGIKRARTGHVNIETVFSGFVLFEKSAHTRE